MTTFVLLTIFIVPTTILFLTGIYLVKRENNIALQLSKVIPALSAVLAIMSLYWILPNGLIETDTFGIAKLGISLRLDSLSIIMYAMVSIIALVVLRFSQNYLEGDSCHNEFMGKLAITVASVQLLVLSGNILILFITWIVTSIALHKLLIFFPKRKKAVLAARKKFIIARIGDVLLLIAFSLIYNVFGSGNLEVIFKQLQQLNLNTVSFQLELSVILLVITAGLKSAQLPFHGWLIEVMEAPTPVSALLHAGLLNAGPFLMIRFAYLLESVHYAPILLFVMGAITALYGAIVFTTQPAIKTALAYSSVAHMGFTLMICGLGVYPAALLHLMAHSFYKAHSFLSSGSVVEKVRTKHAIDFSRKINPIRIVFGFLIAIALYISVGLFWGINFNTEYQLQFIGGVILISIISLMVNSIDSENLWYTMAKIMIAASVVLISFFALEKSISVFLGNQSPSISELEPVIMKLSVTTLAFFFLTVIVLTIYPTLKHYALYKNFGVHARNGFYINLVFDRCINSLNQIKINKEVNQ